LAIGMVLFVALLSVGAPLLLADPDTHWHIAIGDWILKNGMVPTVDTHSHTFLGQPWIAKEWLSQLLLTLAYDAGGWGAVATLCAASIGVTFALLFRLLRRTCWHGRTSSPFLSCYCGSQDWSALSSSAAHHSRYCCWPCSCGPIFMAVSRLA
jgi:hypothetical protein